MMHNPKKRRKREYRDFTFRRRHDHFLRIKLMGAKQEEVIEVAKELGFNIELRDLEREKRAIQKTNTGKKTGNKKNRFRRLILKIIPALLKRAKRQNNTSKKDKSIAIS